MATSLRSIFTLAALAAVLGCVSKTTSTREASPPPRAIPRGSAASVSPVPLPDIATATPPPVEDAGDSLDQCRDEKQPTPDRVTACLSYLDGSPQAAIDDPNVVSERADAIVVLRLLGHQIPLTEAVQRAIGGRLARCVAVHEDAATGVVSLVCRATVCGDAEDWHPYELLPSTGEIKAQQC